MAVPTVLTEIAAVDDHPVMLAGLRAYLEGTDDLRLTLTSPTCEGLLAHDLTGIDVVLLDVELHDGSDPRSNVERITAAGPRVILYTNEHRPAAVRGALRAGARGLVLKGDPDSHLLAAIRTADAGELYVSSRLAMQLATDPVGDVRLSTREREVLERLALGMTWSILAKELGIAIPTARTHMRRALEAFEEAGVTLRGGPREAVARSIRAGHIDPFRRPA